MKQKKLRVPIIIIAIFFIAAGSIYYFQPREFLTEDVLKERINNHYYSVDSPEIQDIVFVGKKHVFVPFISNGQHGTSYWVWRGGKWDLGAISTIQSPRVWKLDPNDPSSYVILWNMDPDDEMITFDLILYNERYYTVSDNVHHYTPRVQLHQTVKVDSEANSYGVMPLPENWLAFLDAYLKVENAKQPSSSFMFDFFPQKHATFAWIPYDVNGEVSFPGPDNASGSGYGNIHLEYMFSIHEHDLE